MLVVEMTYQVTETCQNGKERTFKKKLYASEMFHFEEGRQLLAQKHYYHIIFLGAKWKKVDVLESNGIRVENSFQRV